MKNFTFYTVDIRDIELSELACLSEFKQYSNNSALPKQNW